MPSNPTYTPIGTTSASLPARLKLLLLSKRGLLLALPSLAILLFVLSLALSPYDPSSISSAASSYWPYPSSPETKNPNLGQGVGYAKEGKVGEDGKGVNHRYGMNLHDAFIHISHASEKGKFTGRETSYLRGVPGYSQSKLSIQAFPLTVLDCPACFRGCA